jgi:hypothetical protein
MSAGDSDKTKPRKQFLNVVYFIDSSRTRTLKMPLGRVNLFLFCALMLIAWSVGSAVIIGVLMKDRTDLIANLRQTMQTVFEFESLYDGVYETAYPSGKNQPGKATRQQPALTAGAAVSAPASPVATASANQSASASQATAPAQPASVAGAGQDAKVPASETRKENNVEVVVSNPVVKTSADHLNLTFDLTNKDPKGKSEGYLWATVEFKTDSGQTHILKAPSAIDVNLKGEIEDFKRATYFAIRRFKRNEFQFQLMKGHAGTVVGVKIGISDKPGENRMIYDVPLGIKVGNLDTESIRKPTAGKGGQG